MPNGMWKQCKVPGCPGLTRSKYCDKHADFEERDKQAAASFYNKNIRDQKLQKFYESSAWRKLRGLKLRSMPLCEICYKEERIEQAIIVDHIIEIKDGGAPLDLENLQSLCLICHNKKSAKKKAERNNK